MRVLQVHNRYFRGMGGEDTVLDLEARLLRRHGHEVDQHLVTTSQLRGAGVVQLASAAAGSIWSQHSYREVQTKIDSFQPEIVHVHNTFPLLSPSIFWAVCKAGVPVVSTLHNFRFVCANGILMRDGAPCEDCVDASPLQGLLRRCCNGSIGITGAATAIRMVHDGLGTFRSRVNAYIVLNDFAKSVFVRAGFPGARLKVKPNFVEPTLAARRLVTERGRRITFAGSITNAKGVDLLIEAWKRLQPKGWELAFCGEGPCIETAQKLSSECPSITWRGKLPRAELQRFLAESRYLVLPSRWYEGLPMVVLEGFAAGLPAIVPDHGGFPELVKLSEDGWRFIPGSVDDLVRVIGEAIYLSEADWECLSTRVFGRCREEFGPERNYQLLAEIYRDVSGSQGTYTN